MLPSSICLFILVVLTSLSYAQVQNNQLFRRFEYKHSFRAPNLAQRDGSIPFWVVTGDAIASNEQLRLAPSMRSRKGIAWNKRAYTEAESFEIDFAFKVTGQRIGADGLALWYTAGQGTLGPVYGANDYWTGLALFFDSFDNDGSRNNPYISVMINDGTRSYNHQTDGSSQVLAGCQRDFRNKPYPVRARVQYLNNVLTVEISDGLTPTPRYEACLRAENVFLPRNGYFGTSAATGGLADDHDVVDFSVYSLSTQAQRAASNSIPQEEKTKYDQEFEKQMHEFEEERKKFKQQHPEKAKDDEEDDPTRYYEDIQARELRLVHEGQAQIYQILQQMEIKLTAIQQNSGSVPQTSGQAAVAGPGGFQQHEKNEVIQTLRDLTSVLRDQKNYVNEIFTRTYNIEQKLSGGQNAPIASASAGQATDPQIRTYLENIQNDIRQVRSAQLATSGSGSQPLTNCPDSSCTSTTIFFVIILVQTAVILVFVFIRSKHDKAKFY